MWRNHQGHSTEGPEEIQIELASKVMRGSTSIANVGSWETKTIDRIEKSWRKSLWQRERHAVSAERRCHEQWLVGPHG
jgi:hypothetical protein